MRTIFPRVVVLSASLLLSEHLLWAADVIKTNNIDNLNLGSSWVGGVVPGASDVAVWDSTVTAANAVELGANLEFLGLRITNPGGRVDIGGANTLTIGAGGIDMSSATRDMNITATVRLSSTQTWQMATGRLLDSNNNRNNAGISVDNQGHTLTVSGAGDVDIGKLVGAGGIVMNGTGRLALQSANSGDYDYSGDVTLNSGTLRVGNWVDALGSGSLFLNGGTLTFSSNSARDFGRNTTVAGNVTLINNNANNTGAQDYSFGTLNIGTHTMTVNRNAAGSTAGNITFRATTLSGDATFNVGPHGTNSPALNQFTLGAVGESGGSRGLIKTGEGILILASNTTYTGATDIQGGTLRLGANGTLSSTTSITVHASAVLDVSAVSGGLILGTGQELSGSGAVRGSLTVGADAILSPGIGLGVLSVSNLTLAAGSIIDWEFENESDAGTTYDQIAGSGLLTLNGTPGDRIIVNIIGLAGHTVSLGDTFVLYDGAVTGFDANAIELVNNSSWTGGWSISDGSSLVLEAIPEPSVLWLLIAGFSALFIRYRRMNI